MAEQFTQKIKTVFKLAFEPKLLKALLSLRHRQYLVDIGWINAFKSKSSVDKNNNPIPWVTYPFIDFITPRLNKSMVIFEFGSGNSTLFYSKRVKRVVAVEHNLEWYEKLKSSLPKNVEIIYKELSSQNNYASSILEINAKFDIVIIDGEERNECMKISVEALKENGVVVLDDSEREEYTEGIEYLSSKSFKRIDFWGISPGYLNRRATTVFYKSNNCLGI